jgi:flagellar protein FliO/FliZ
VQVGEGESGRCLVLGVAPGGVTVLHSLALSASLPDVSAASPDASAPAPSSFAARLAQLVQPKNPTKSP